MDLNDYQKVVAETAVFPPQPEIEGVAIYPVLGLVGESGEFAEKVKKGIRDGQLDRAGAIKELGDVLWYVAACAVALGVDLNQVAEENLVKLHDRKKRDRIKGEGDDR